MNNVSGIFKREKVGFDFLETACNVSLKLRYFVIKEEMMR